MTLSLSFICLVEMFVPFVLEHMWVIPKIGVPQNGWFIMENPIKMDHLGVPLFLETPMWGSLKDQSILTPPL